MKAEDVKPGKNGATYAFWLDRQKDSAGAESSRWAGTVGPQTTIHSPHGHSDSSANFSKLSSPTFCVPSANTQVG